MTSSRIVSLCAVVLMATAAVASAALVDTINPTVRGATYGNFVGIYHGTGTVGRWYSPDGSDYVYYAKYDIPVYPGAILEVLVNCDVTSQLNSPYHAGLILRRVEDDSWTSSTVTVGWPHSADSVTNRYASDTGGTPFGLVSSDITAWLDQPGEGPGETLSIKFMRTGGGNRGLLMNMPTLTITYVPEPATMMLLGLGGLAALARRRR